MVAIYRLFIFSLIFLLLFSFFFPWGFFYRGGSISALYWLGEDSLVSDRSIIFVSNLLAISYFLIYLGMIFYRNWARIALVAVSLVGGIAIPLYGISVQSGFEAMIGYFITLGDGAVISISFFSSLGSKFSK